MKNAENNKVAGNAAGGTMSRGRILLAALLLAVVVVAVFWPSGNVAFLNCDDDVYVSDNPYVLQGVTLSGLRWAMGIHENYWIPVTWLSFMIDAQVHGAQPWGYRLTNVLFHGVNAGLFFLFLLQVCRRPWVAALAALLFALHPLRVESVAWISERKDVLCVFFGLLALLGYLRFARSRSRLAYAGVMAAFALSLMAKPAWVTLPALLLLLDLTVLRRDFRGRAWVMPVLEKAPIFLLGLGFAVLTMASQSASIHSLQAYGLMDRIANSLGAYGFYLMKTVWPAGLSVAYSDIRPEAGVVVLLAVLLFAGSGWALRKGLAGSAAGAGWLWFMLALLPVIGLVRVGTVHVADRFTYIPHMGLALLAASGLLVLQGSYPRIARAAGSVAATVLLAFVFQVRADLTRWSDSFVLFRSALEVDGQQVFALNNMGALYLDEGDFVRAENCFQKALRVQPDCGPAQLNLALVYLRSGHQARAEEMLMALAGRQARNPQVLNNLGALLAERGEHEKAIAMFQRAIDADPSLLHFRYNLGLSLLSLGRPDEAIAVFEAVLKLAPGDARARFLAGRSWLEKKQAAPAVVFLHQALESSPGQLEVREALGEGLLALGRREEAAVHYEHILTREPDRISALNSLAWIYGSAEPGSTVEKPERAVELAERAARLTGRGEPSVLDTLAVAYASSRRLADALEVSRQALSLAEAGGYQALAGEIRHRIDVFEQGSMWIEHEGPVSSGSG